MSAEYSLSIEDFLESHVSFQKVRNLCQCETQMGLWVSFVWAFILTRLDYCNSWLDICPQYLTDRLQKFRTQLHDSSAKPEITPNNKGTAMSNPYCSHLLPARAWIQYKRTLLFIINASNENLSFGSLEFHTIKGQVVQYNKGKSIHIKWSKTPWNITSEIS